MSLCIPYISLIYAVSNNGIIGKAGGIPWKSPADFKWFKERTLHHIVVMGRKTWESLPVKPLPDRVNVVITSQENYVAEGALVTKNLYDAVVESRRMEPAAQVFIIGGKALLEEGMRLAFDAWVSKIDVDPEIDNTCVKEPVLPDTAVLDEVFNLFEGSGNYPRVTVRHIKF